MLKKKKPTSKKPKPKEKKKVNEKYKTTDTGQTETTPPAKGQPIQEAKEDPGIERIKRQQAAAEGKYVPPTKPTKLEDKKPEEMTGPEELAMMTGGGVLPKEQADKEKAAVGPTGPVQPPPPGASQK